MKSSLDSYASFVRRSASPTKLADALAELLAERRKGKEARASPIIQTIFGRRASRFDEFAQRHAAIFRGEQPALKV